MKLAILTQPQFFIEEDKIITALFDEGLDSLHLLKPGAEPLYLERLLSLIPEDYHRKIIIHEHYYMKQEFDLGGIHLDNLEQEKPQGYKGKVSRSCNDLSRLKEMKKQSEYVLLHNIHDGIHNPEYKAAFTNEEIHEASRQGLIDKHVYALGGMSAENIRMAKDEGFGGVVVCGDLWNKFNIHHQIDYHDLITHFQRLYKCTK